MATVVRFIRHFKSDRYTCHCRHGTDVHASCPGTQCLARDCSCGRFAPLTGPAPRYRLPASKLPPERPWRRDIRLAVDFYTDRRTYSESDGLREV